MPTQSGAPWRLIISSPAPGRLNMALDEAILEAVSAGQAPTTLRLYAWTPACLSLGVAQPTSDADLEGLQRAGWDLVRRPTGGRAILHTDELTYAVAAGIGDPHVAGGIMPSYRHLSRGLMSALSQLGLKVQTTPGEPLEPAPSGNPVCFENPSAYEITAGTRKLIGSAQVRRKRGVLQHGTLPLGGDLGRICLALRFEDEGAREAAATRVRERAATVEDLLGKTPPWASVADAFRVGFERALGITLTAGQPSEGENQRAHALVAERYGNDEWTFRI